MKDIEYVTMIAQCKSISKASEQLYVSQPSLSRYINKLERDLGVRLFERTSAGICLTEAGKIYVEYSEQIQALRRTMESKLRSLRDDNEQNIRIGMTLNASYMSGEKIKRMLHGKYPACNLSISNIRSTDMIPLLKRHECDFIIGPALWEEGPDIISEVISEEYLLLLVPDRWDLREYSETREGVPYPWIDLRKIIGQVNFIIQDSSSAVWRDLQDVLQTYGITLETSMNTINSTLAIQAAEAKLGCCFASETFLPYISNPSLFQRYCIGTPVKRSYSSLHWLKDARLSKEKRYCMSVVRQIVIEDYRRIVGMSQNAT